MVNSATEVMVYTTAKDTDKRLSLTDKLTFEPGVQPFENEVSVFVNPNKRYQKVLGFGGAITDASSEVFAKLPADKQEELLKAYFDKEEGIGYRKISYKLNSWGIKTPRGKKWFNTSVHSVLKRKHQRDLRVEEQRNEKFSIKIGRFKTKYYSV